jgi:hypothetical protein
LLLFLTAHPHTSDLSLFFARTPTPLPPYRGPCKMARASSVSARFVFCCGLCFLLHSPTPHTQLIHLNWYRGFSFHELQQRTTDM